MKRKFFWIYVLSSAVYFTQGIEGLPSQGLFYYLKETLNYSPQKIMFLSSLTIGTWLIKPVIGYIIDNFFTKRIWIFIALAFDILTVLFMGLFSLPIVILVTMLVFNSSNSAFRDVAVDGIMCVEGKANQITGKIQSIQWISISISGLFTGIAGGYIAHKWGYQVAFLCLIPIYLLVGLTTFFYSEPKVSISRYKANSFFQDLKRLFANKQLIIVGLFILLYKYSPSFGTPLFFIQRDTFKWSKIFIGTMATVSTVFEVSGALLYYKLSTKINIKKWLYISVFVGAVTALSYLYYTPITAIIYNLVYSFAGMFIFLMIMDFMARKTVKGLEATSFALLCSMSNLALVLSNLSGAFLLPIIGLKWLIVISSLTSFLCLLLINKIGQIPSSDEQ